jgi:hypothetical protein
VQRDIDTSTERLASLERAVKSSAAARQQRAVKRAPSLRQDGETARLQSLLASKQQTIADLDGFRHRRLAELQEQLASQEATYSSQHPVIINLRQTIEQMSRPSPQLEAARNEARDLEREIVRRGGRAVDPAPTLALPVEPPTREATEPAALDDDPRVEYERGHLRLLFTRYWTLRDRIDSARVELDTAQAAFKYRYSVITPPQMPTAPAKPVPVRVVLASILGGIAFALFVSIAADIRSGMIVERWQIERRLGLPVLADLRRR